MTVGVSTKAQFHLAAFVLLPGRDGLLLSNEHAAGNFNALGIDPAAVLAQQ
jgi:hypothetical protein